MDKRILVLGGGTFEPIANHLSLSAPAFGTIAKELAIRLGGELVLTKMANPESTLLTSQDVWEYLEEQLKDESLGTIVLSVAFCDFELYNEIGSSDKAENRLHAERYHTSEGIKEIKIIPTEKIVDKLRRLRPDIFLVGFKTTTKKTEDEQFISGLKMMKRSKCNLVLANDVITRNNIIITPEESFYKTSSREDAIEQLCEMIRTRQVGTYTRSRLFEGSNIPITDLPSTFTEVLGMVIKAGGFIINNGNGFTPGHFGYRSGSHSFISSQRKVNHNDVFEVGLSLVEIGDDDTFTVFGTKKASVGAKSQWLMYQENPDYDCIIHVHCPIKEGSQVLVVPQKPFQCGSLECGMNTVNNLVDYDGIKAVYLDKHGPNILFKSTQDPNMVMKFINDNFQLGIKTT